MIVGSQLESAQLEGVSDDTTCTNLAQVQYNTVTDGIRVKTASDVKGVFPMAANTVAEFRSAMYPIGSFIHSFLETAAFEAEMGSGKWINVGEYQYRDSVHGVLLIKKTTDFGIYLGTVGGYTSENDGDGEDCWVWANDPTGKYLRVSGTHLGITYDKGDYLDSWNKVHHHSNSVSESRREYDSDGYLSDCWSSTDLRTSSKIAYSTRKVGGGFVTKTVLRGNAIDSGESESRPETTVFNLYLKVER